MSWSLLYWAKAPDAPSFNRLSLFSRTLTSLNTSLNSPGGECNIKSETIRTFSWSGITASPSAAILPFPLARTLRRRRRHRHRRRRCQVESEGTYGTVVTDGGQVVLGLSSGSWLRISSRGAARGGVTIYRVARADQFAVPVLPFFFLLSSGSSSSLRQFPRIRLPHHVLMFATSVHSCSCFVIETTLAVLKSVPPRLTINIIGVVCQSIKFEEFNLES